MKEKAAIGVNMPAMPAMSSMSSASAATPFRTARVPIAFSFAISAEMTATAPFQSPRPTGAKIQEIAPPKAASMESSISTISMDALNAEKNQMMTQAAKMMVPALMMKPFALSHI